VFYRNFLKPILFKFPPELVHDVFMTIGEFLGRFVFTRSLVGLIYEYKRDDAQVVVDGLTYKTPLILSAGFDYNGRLTQILSKLSFGGVEVGSVTSRPCKGNEYPRLKRLPLSQSILVNKGLRNDGVDVIIKRLKSRHQKEKLIIGVSIARTNDKTSASVEDGIADYCYSFRRLNEENVGDFYTLNISCPNAYGGEVFTTPLLLERLLTEIKKIPCPKPVYIKLPINLSWEEIDKIVNIIKRLKFQGVIAGNLNKSYESLHLDEVPTAYEGGVSGKPCANLSNDIISKIKKKYGNQLTIIGCGGVMTSKDALIKFDLGSDLIALITGMIYSGPGLLKEISKNYARRNKPGANSSMG